MEKGCKMKYSYEEVKRISGILTLAMILSVPAGIKMEQLEKRLGKVAKKIINDLDGHFFIDFGSWSDGHSLQERTLEDEINLWNRAGIIEVDNGKIRLTSLGTEVLLDLLRKEV